MSEETPPIEAPVAEAPKVPVSPPAWWDRLQGESADLADRIAALQAFMASPQFNEASERQRTLMKSQHALEVLLLEVLMDRLEAA